MEYLPLLAEEGGWLRRWRPWPNGPLLQVVLHPRQPACPRRARASAALEIVILLHVEMPCAPSEAALYAELLVERLINLNRTSPGQVNAHAPAGVSRGELERIMATGGALELANAQACWR